MTSAIELHDSEIVEISQLSAGDGELILDAYVHRSAGVPGVSPGEGGEQRVRITIESMVMTGDFGILPATIAGGSLKCGGVEANNLLPLPSDFAGDLSLNLTFRDVGRSITIAAKYLSIQPEGEFRFLEMFEPC